MMLPIPKQLAILGLRDAMKKKVTRREQFRKRDAPKFDCRSGKFATHQHLLRAMDALMDNAEPVEEALARQIRPLVDHELTMVFYDLTTVRIHGEARLEDDVCAFGMNKETGGIARQFVLGVVHPSSTAN